MTTAAAVLPPGLVKEIRALFPTYGLILVAVVAGSLGHSHTMIATGLLGYAFGSVALGAQSFGHEYSYRTLGLLLAQPADRRRLLLYKLAVLSVMLVTLSAATVLLFREVLQLARSPHTEPSMLVLAAACGLFIAPLLSMLCRSTLAAVVFTIAIPGVLAVAADIVGGLIYGLHNAAAIDQFKLAVFWRGMYLICALSAVAGWWTFTRLEVIEGHADVQLPELLGRRDTTVAGRPRRRHHPISALVRKELRLQQMAFVVAAIYVVLWLALAWLDRRAPDSQRLPLTPLAMLYGGTLMILIGSLASAEERQLGTLEWQTLLPSPAWQQWGVKVGGTFGLALLLGVGLPMLLSSLGLSRDDPGEQLWRRVIPMFVLLTAVSLYLSTLCKSGVGALVLSFPTVAATGLLIQFVGGELWQVWAGRGAQVRISIDGTWLLELAVCGGLVALLLWFAYGNHRSADRSTVRTLKQVLGLTSYIIASLAALIAMGLR